MTPGWTLEEASAQFAETGIPIDAGQLRVIVRALRIRPVGETPPGERGGRGHALYPIGELQRLHSALAPWLTRPA